MIPSRELRIGNWVEYKVHGKDEWVAAPVFMIRHNDENEYKRPIPLTPEILEKAGFEKVRYFWQLLDICVFEGMNVEIYPMESRESIELPHIKHLHQLQNLYFALTGTELEINL